MGSNPYSKYNNKELILRDELAIERTVLANERTILAYFRTTLGIIVIGISIIKLFDLYILKISGIILLAIAIMVFIFGIYRFLKIRSFINKIRNKNN